MTPSTYRLRLRLPDQPGTLGLVASALGTVEADIESIVVVDREAGYAVDDLVVSLPPGGLADRLVSAATSVPGVIVETVQRHQGQMRLAEELTLLDAAVTAEDPLTVLINGLPGVFQASYALLVGHARAVISAAAPTPAPRTGWLPIGEPRLVDASDVWTCAEVAGPDPSLAGAAYDGGAAIVVGRIGGPEFRPAELMRLAHVAAVVQLAARARPSRA